MKHLVTWILNYTDFHIQEDIWTEGYVNMSTLGNSLSESCGFYMYTVASFITMILIVEHWYPWVMGYLYIALFKHTDIKIKCLLKF